MISSVTITDIDGDFFTATRDLDGIHVNVTVQAPSLEGVPSITVALHRDDLKQLVELLELESGA